MASEKGTLLKPVILQQLTFFSVRTIADKHRHAACNEHS